MVGNALSEAPEDRRDLPGARVQLEQSARLFDDVGDRHYALIARHNQAWIVGELGDREAEDRLHRETLEIAREIGNESIEADSLAQLGMAARDEGRLDEAVELLQEAIRIDHRRGMTSNLATQLGRLASVHVRARRWALAAKLVAAARALTEGLGAEMTWWSKRRNDETLDLLRASGVDADELQGWLDGGRVMSVDEVVELATSDRGPR
jgi:tetratricopeptide (TPR) repeat protein